MGKGQKICCAVCCGILVVLVIMIPVGLFAIAPKLSQHYLDQSTLTITNATLYFPSKRENQTWAMQTVHATMHNPAPFGVTVKEFKQKMYMYASQDNFKTFGVNMGNITGEQLAEFTFPQQTLKKGNNEIVVTVNMTLTSGKYDCGKTASCFGLFQSLAAFAGPHSVFKGINAYMVLKGDDMHIKSMGLGVPGKFSSSFSLNCSAYGFMNETTGEWQTELAPKDPIDWKTDPDCVYAGGCVKPAQIMCDSSTIPAVAEPGYITTTTTSTTSTSTEAPTTTTTTTVMSKEFLM